MLNSLDEPLTEEMIKKFHFILKEGTLSDEERTWFNVGEYKKVKNFVGDIEISEPKNVSKDMKDLLSEYNSKDDKTIYDIIDFHARFEYIHPF